MSNKTIIIKIGTNTLFEEDVLRDDVIDSLAVSINELRKEGINFAIVTSGAVQSGANELNLSERPKKPQGVTGSICSWSSQSYKQI